MNTLIIGMGEIGNSLCKILSKVYDVQVRDTPEIELKFPIQMMHICIRYSDEFEKIVSDYIKEYSPDYVNICSTVPPGTTARIQSNFPVCRIAHSTTRGLHPNLAEGMLTIKKHIGSPYAEEFKTYFEEAKIPCVAHQTAITTELAHILNNATYGINLMFADEMARLCRHYGVDYTEAVTLYTMTNNEGYEKLGHPSKRRMVLTPPNGKIGGHCVVQSANLIEEHLRQPLLNRLAEYNNLDFAPSMKPTDAVWTITSFK